MSQDMRWTCLPRAAPVFDFPAVPRYRNNDRRGRGQAVSERVIRRYQALTTSSEVSTSCIKSTSSPRDNIEASALVCTGRTGRHNQALRPIAALPT